MLNKFKFIQHKDFKNFSILSIGIIFANSIPIILQPILKSLYSPEVFGYFEIYFRLSSFLVILFSLRYDYLIFSSKSQKQLTKNLKFVVNLIFFNFLFSLLILFLIDDILLMKFKLPTNFYFILWLIPISAFFMACFRLLIFYKTQSSKFTVIALSRIYRRFSEGVTQILIGISSFSGLGLFLGEIFGNFIALFKLSKDNLNLNLIDKGSFYFNFKHFYLIFIKNIKYPVNKGIPDILSQISESILIILILREFGIIYVGLIELSYKILVIPVTIVGAAIAPLILQKVSEAINKKLLIDELKIIALLILLISLIFYLSTYFLLENLFIFFFDDIWFQSYIFITILVYLVCLQLIVSPFGEVLILLDKLWIDALWKYMKVIVLSVLFFFQFKDINNLVLVYTSISFGLYIIYFIIIIFYIYQHDKKLIK